MRRARADAAPPPPYAAARRFARVGESLGARSNVGGSGRSGNADDETATEGWARCSPDASSSIDVGVPAYADGARSFFSSVFLRRSCNLFSIAAARPTAPLSGRASRGDEGTRGDEGARDASGADARTCVILCDSVVDDSTARATASRTASSARSARGVLLSSFAASLNLRTTSDARAEATDRLPTPATRPGSVPLLVLLRVSHLRAV